MNTNLKAEDIVNATVNLNRSLINNKPHIKKYDKVKKIYKDIIDNMKDYIFSDSYDIDKNIDKMCLSFMEDNNIDRYNWHVNSDNISDALLLEELLIFKNHEDVTSVTEIYLQKNKFRNEEKVKLLQCMNNSFASLFKVISSDVSNGYVVIKDFFTDKEYQVIDINLASAYSFVSEQGKNNVYIYSRLITYDDISILTGGICFVEVINKLKNILYHKKLYEDMRSSSLCLLLFEISKHH